MRLRDTVQSKWFKVEDLPGRENGSKVVTIARIGSSKFNDGRESLDLYFHEHPKPLGCNATNRKRLMAMFGEDVEIEDLIGQRIELYAELTQDQKGTPCWGVRIRPPMATMQSASAQARERIQAAQARNAVAPMRPSRVPQDAPADHPRPMSHRSAPNDWAAAEQHEPAGFVDDQDPGPAGWSDQDGGAFR